MSIRLSLATVLVLPQVFGVACGSSTSESPTDGSAFADAGHLPKGGDATSETGPTCVPGSTCTSPDTCEDGGKASACGSHADRDAASGSDSASGHDAGGGPASDPFPRTFLRVIGDPLSAVSASNTLAGVPFSTLVAEYNAVDINPYLGTEGSIGDSWASVIKGWKSAATANGVALRAFLYSGGGAPDFAANSTYKWLPNAFSAANMWTYSTTTGPFGSSHTVGYSSGGGQIQSYWQISSDDIQTIPDATINGIATAPGLVGANVWQAYAQYYYDVFVNGLAASKYNESASYAANPDLDGIEYDNATPTARYVPVAGNWFGFTKAVSGYNASTTTAMMKGWAKLIATMKSINPSFLNFGNAGEGLFPGYDVIDPSMSGTWDLTLAEGTFGESYSSETTQSSPGSFMAQLIFAEGLVNLTTGTMVIGSYGFPGGTPFSGSAQSSWTVQQWQGTRMEFACAMMRNWHFAPSGANHPGNAMLFDEQVQEGNHGWLSAGTQRLDPPQSAAWSNGVWRRRFPNGWVLWNPRANGPRTVIIPSTLCRIRTRGYGDSTVNTGGCGATSVKLEDADGLFLIGTG
jgi:hypothetical protein